MAGVAPSPESSGSALTLWTVIRYLLARGHTVGAVVLVGDEHEDPGANFDRRLAKLRELGVEVRQIGSRAAEIYEEMGVGLRSRVRRAWRPSIEELFPKLLDAPAVAEAVKDLAPDVAYVYHWDAVAATRSLRGRTPRLATVIDLPQFSLFYRWRSQPRRLDRAGLAHVVWLQARLRHQPGLMVELLNECEASANFAAHHAAWLRRRGAAGCAYLRTPIEDQPGSDWRRLRERAQADDRPRLLLIGHLRGISTQEGLESFAISILPRLERALGRDGFEVRLVGGYGVPRHLGPVLDHPAVRFLGYVDDAGAEFASADGLVVPTSIPLGARVRILSALSFGCPVVAHEANALGIPELAHGDNALLGRNGRELAEAFLGLAGDDELQRRLETRGRETYERFFAPNVAAAPIEETLARLGAGRRVRAPAGSR
jgi:glycosyltransferase involved in cell wall biosynthesis